MAADTYKDFNDLTQHEVLNIDYKLSIRDTGSPVTIIAPHGGKIEPRTSDIVKNIAREGYNYYCFEGIKERNNGRLHLTSHRFDEPKAIQIISKSRVVIAIHACTGSDGMVYAGGLNKALTNRIAWELEVRGISVRKGHSRFQGLNPKNICNRGATQKGVQLEIMRDLRDDLKKVHVISDAIRAALIKNQSTTDRTEFKRHLPAKMHSLHDG